MEEFTQAIILDVGDGQVRAGYSGECSPRFTASLVLGLPLGHEATLKHTIFPLCPDIKRDNVELMYAAKYKYENNMNTCEYNYAYMEKMLEDISGSKALDENLHDHPILLTEPNKTDTTYREALTEILFESCNVPNLFLSRRSVLSCYGCARTSGLVLSVETNGTELCALQDGYIFQKHIEQIPIGGNLIDRIYLGYLQNIKNIKIYPYFAIEKTYNAIASKEDINILKCPLVTKPYYLWGSLYVANQLKEYINNDGVPGYTYEIRDIKNNSSNNNTTTTSVNNATSDNKNTDDNKITGDNTFCDNRKTYILPDGNVLDEKICSCLKLIIPYIFFKKKCNENTVMKFLGTNAPVLNSFDLKMFYDFLQVMKLPVLEMSEYAINPTSSIIEKVQDNSKENVPICCADKIETYFELFDGLQNFVKKGILSLISGNITASDILNFLIVTGESSSSHNFAEMLKSCLPFIDTIKEKSTRLIYSRGVDRRHNCFIGASILSSLGTFPQLCISKAEYDEHGARNIVEKKCA